MLIRCFQQNTSPDYWTAKDLFPWPDDTVGIGRLSILCESPSIIVTDLFWKQSKKAGADISLLSGRGILSGERRIL